MALTPDYINVAAGSTFFSRIEADPQGAQRKLRRIDTSGQNGVAFLAEEKKPEPFKGISEAYVSTTLYDADNAADLRQVYDELVGQMVTLGLQGVDYDDILVLGVHVRPHIPLVAAYFVYDPDGVQMSEDAYLVTAEWDFIYAGVVS